MYPFNAIKKNLYKQLPNSWSITPDIMLGKKLKCEVTYSKYDTNLEKCNFANENDNNYDESVMRQVHHL